MAFLTLTHYDPILLTEAIMEYEANDGCFNYLTHRISSRWMHLQAGMPIIVDLVSRPVQWNKSLDIVVIGEGLFSRDKNVTIESTKSLIITNDAFEANQYSMMLTNVKHCLIKSHRKKVPPVNLIITPKCYATYMLNETYHRIIFPFNFNQRQLIFKHCKFSYSLSQFCIFYDWQVFQTFVLKKAYKPPKVTFLKAIKIPPTRPPFHLMNSTFSCDKCNVSSLNTIWQCNTIFLCKNCKKNEPCQKKFINQNSYFTIEQHLSVFDNVQCIVFDDRSNVDFYNEYVAYQKGKKKQIHVSPPLHIERCDTRAFDKVVIIASRLDSSRSSFVTSLRRICHEQHLDIYIIYTHKQMKIVYTALQTTITTTTNANQ